MDINQTGTKTQVYGNLKTSFKYFHFKNKSSKTSKANKRSRSSEICNWGKEKKNFFFNLKKKSLKKIKLNVYWTSKNEKKTYLQINSQSCVIEKVFMINEKHIKNQSVPGSDLNIPFNHFFFLEIYFPSLLSLFFISLQLF